jgi:hypothetical protein
VLQGDCVEKWYVKLLTVTSVQAVKSFLPSLFDSPSYVPVLTRVTHSLRSAEHLPCEFYHVHTMPAATGNLYCAQCPCCTVCSIPVVLVWYTIKANSHMPCHAPAILRQCRVLCVIPRGSRKFLNCWSHSLTGWYASDNLCGTPRGGRKKLNAGRSSTCCLWMVDANSHMPCHDHAVPWPWEITFRTAWAQLTCVNQTQLPCVNQMGKTQSKPYQHGMAWEQHGMCELALTRAWSVSTQLFLWLFEMK